MWNQKGLINMARKTSKKATRAAAKPAAKKRAAPAAAATSKRSPAVAAAPIIPATVAVVDAPDFDELVERIILHVITDLNELRRKAAEQMGDFADEAKGPELIQTIKRRHASTGTTFDVHPLDPHVLEGARGINPRDFSQPQYIRRVAELAVSIAARGVVKAAPMVVRTIDGEDRIMLKGGHSRNRAALLCWALKDKPELLGGDAPRKFPVALGRVGNDVDDVLDFALDNDQMALSPLEEAMLFCHAVELGASEEDIARKTGKSVAVVKKRLAMMEMPQKLLGYVRSGTITPTFAYQCWQAAKEDRDAEVALVEGGIEKQKAQSSSGSARVTARHAGLPSRPSGRPASAPSQSQQSLIDRLQAENSGYRKLLDRASGLRHCMDPKDRGDGFVRVLMDVKWEEWQELAGKLMWPKMPEPVEEGGEAEVKAA